MLIFVSRSLLSAVIPGRSDNDVKNRWHSKMRSQKLKREKTLEASVDAAPAHEKKRAILKSPNNEVEGDLYFVLITIKLQISKFTAISHRRQR